MVTINPKDSNAWLNLGSVYANLQDIEKAIEVFEKIIELDPKNSLALYNIGMMYGGLEDPVKGIEYVESALKIDPSNEDAKSALNLLSLMKEELERKGKI